MVATTCIGRIFNQTNEMIEEFKVAEQFSCVIVVPFQSQAGSFEGYTDIFSLKPLLTFVTASY
jgi:hypothetical protein